LVVEHNTVLSKIAFSLATFFGVWAKIISAP